MTDKFDGYTEALTALIREAIRCSPESWAKGQLTIQCDGHRIDYKLKNAGSEDKAVISKELAQLCEDYWGAFMKNGEPWIESEVEFLRVDGEWTFNANYKYPTQPAPAVQPRKPFWKFWH
ncbi:hypothetical protein WR30_17205 [Burkholderia contaminans FFH2055]|uniref:hypothetical protein n=1 Tax=Burkholderia contaminans TaxID=488447 RepID=UPI00062675F2|nr:hypothetical protein [Burkholderia contaminans]KKL35454.1 hypothetical protein WR30_17205 [Burkholderia contaminans FFH2055]MEB4639765.1 hypothetical protein [Burkholderia contaminans]MEB4654745.1 hypothetical protein [Burkholderia contaminans]MEB4659289.1 hypothetical protein [Burkholderia contaminans]MEB4669663.1 hypothetical protein [Burkholderia contaminans]